MNKLRKKRHKIAISPVFDIPDTRLRARWRRKTAMRQRDTYCMTEKLKFYSPLLAFGRVIEWQKKRESSIRLLGKTWKPAFCKPLEEIIVLHFFFLI